jgi:hypothetical protein
MANPPLSPDAEAAISALFALFLAYTKARSSRGREELERQILALFESLGAMEHHALIEARATFEGMRSPLVSGGKRARNIADNARDFVTYRIRIFENTPSNPKLSGAAREMLRIPLSEVTSRLGQFDEGQADASLGRILGSMKESPTSEIEGDGKLRTSLSVIRAFAKNFCNIPPFCSGKAR